MRTALAGDPARVPVCWYGQQEASWVAYYDALHRLGTARYQPDDLGYWAVLARSCGWWWTGEVRWTAAYLNLRDNQQVNRVAI